jgi:hypothetical protein
MKLVSTELFAERLGCDIYPITFIKFILNKRKILHYFTTASGSNFRTGVPSYKIDHTGCRSCQSKVDQNMLCRQHTSIQRVLTAEKVGYDADTHVFFYKNEIFRMIGNRLVIVYCPHTKLILGDLTDEKVRKVIPITVEDPSLTSLPEYESVQQFITTPLIGSYMKCWFDHTFSVVTHPQDHEGDNDWYLVPNN